MQENPEEYAATQAVYDVLREGLSSSERRITMTPEAYLAAKSVKEVLAQGIQLSVSRSGSRDQLTQMVSMQEVKEEEEEDRTRFEIYKP